MCIFLSLSGVAVEIADVLYVSGSSLKRSAYLQSPSFRPMARFSPDDTRHGELPPWEVAKAYAFKVALDKLAETLEKPASKFVGEPVPDFIASQLQRPP